MRPLFAVLLMLALALGLGSPRAADADPGIELLPRRIVFGVGQADAELVMVNRTLRPLTFHITFERLRMDVRGNWSVAAAAAEGEEFADELVRLAPRRGEIAPGGLQIVRLQRFATPAGDEARAHVAVHFTAGGGGSVVNIPVLVKARPNAAAEVSAVRWVTPEAVEVVIARRGSTTVYGSVELDWLRPDGGREPAHRREVAVYPPLNERIVTVAVAPKGEGWLLRARYQYAESIAP